MKTKNKCSKQFAKLIANIKNWSKKKKIIAICIVVFLVLAIIGGTVAGVLLSRKPGDTVNLTYKRYYYAIEANDSDGIILNSGWKQGLDAANFTLSDDSTRLLSLSKDDVLTVSGAVEPWVEYDLKYNYKTQLVAEFKVMVTGDAVNINNLADLTAIPDGAKGVYIVGSDIDAVDSVSIKNFGGLFFANHHSISNLNVSVNGGLFDSVNDGSVYSLNLTAVRGSINNVAGGNYGAIANYAYSSNFYYCSADGDISVTFSPSLENVNNYEICVGSMFGYLNDAERKSDIDPNVNSVRFCNSKINLKILARGNIYLGGVVGKVLNATVIATSSSGAINASLEHSPLAFIGGVAGQIEKSVKEYGKLIRSYDIGGNLYSNGDITVTSVGYHSFYSLYVGGVVGSVINHNLSGLTCNGDVSVSAEESVLFVAKAVAIATNGGDEGIIIPMEVAGMDCKGRIIATVKNGTQPIVSNNVAKNNGVSVK